MFVFRDCDPPVDIKPMVQKIIGVANGEDEVNRTAAHDDAALYTKLTTVTGGHSLSVVAGMQLLKEALRSVENGNSGDDREFCILFILEAFGYYLGTRSSKAMEREYLRYFRGRQTLEDLKNMKWCDLIADCLLDHIVAYKKRNVQMCFGAVIILEVTDVLSSECL
jgi:hypothetical protein